MAEVDKRMSLLKGTMSYADLKDVDLVIEAIFENMGVKKEVFKKLAAATKPSCILGTNTSALDIDEIASVIPLERREKVIGLHFFRWVAPSSVTV